MIKPLQKFLKLARYPYWFLTGWGLFWVLTWLMLVATSGKALSQKVSLNSALFPLLTKEQPVEDPLYLATFNDSAQLHLFSFNYLDWLVNYQPPDYLFLKTLSHRLDSKVNPSQPLSFPPNFQVIFWDLDEANSVVTRSVSLPVCQQDLINLGCSFSQIFPAQSQPSDPKNVTEIFSFDTF